MSTLGPGTQATVVLSHLDTKGIYSNPFTGPSRELAELTSTLLNKNHQDFHIYFNDRGYHNHTVHHLLSLYALNANTVDIRKAFNGDASYQRPLTPHNAEIVNDMQKAKVNITKYLPGDENALAVSNEFSGAQYANFLEFWSREIEQHGVKGVLDEWVFRGDEVAEKIFGRLFSGFIHPFIHLGFALEFHQPAILAEALAQACVHENWVYPLIEGCAAKSNILKQSNTPPRPLTDLLDEAYNTSKLRDSVRYDDANKLRDGVLKRAGPELIDLASQWYVLEHSSWDTIHEKVAEHIHAAFLFASTAAFHTTMQPIDNNTTKTIRHQPKFDFFYVHATNASIFLTSFANDARVRAMLGRENMIRLLEAKTRVDICMYLSRRAHHINQDTLSLIQTYEAKSPADRNASWQTILTRAATLPFDDGHGVKFIRALANAEHVCRPFADRAWCVIKDDMWRRIGWMAIDSFSSKPDFVRNAGWDEAWTDVPEWTWASRL